MKMWYDKEAEIWEDALPLGNGRLGAMVWSGVSLERVSLNLDSLWSGYPRDTNVPGAAEAYKEARDLALNGKCHEAEAIIAKRITGPFTQGYLPLGEMLLTVPGDGEVTGYKRQLDLETAVSTLTYTQNGTRYTRESFVSAPDKAFVMKISADKAGAVSFYARLTSQLRSFATTDKGRLILDGVAPSTARPSYLKQDRAIIYEEDENKRGMRFMALVDFEADGGEVVSEGGVLRVNGANSVVVRLCAQTSFNGAFRRPFTDGTPYAEICEADLAHGRESDYETLKKRHIEDYQSLYGRVKMDLGQGRGDLPTTKRLEGWESAENDPELFVMLFQFGRYLMISGSRRGTVPLNLQGIWNQHLRAPWSGNFTININAEMNYWPAETVNLSECHEPFLSFIGDTLRVTGAKTAQAHYDAKGFVAHHNTDIWGLSNPVGEGGLVGCGFWGLSAGWLSAHAFEHYDFTRDEGYLREKGWPIVRDAARFFLDVLVPDKDGTLIFAPSTSPENCYKIDGKIYPVAKTVAMTVAIIKETLENAVKCCDILGVDAAFKAEAAEALTKMPKHKIGARGEFLEWDDDYVENEPTHRHVSHLYPLYPGHAVTPDKTPEFAAACRRTLDLRGEESTGWGLAWRVNLWARLRDGERAFNVLKKQVRPVGGSSVNYQNGGGCYTNLFGAHPPFQIDSNFGACAGIAEMLMQSGDGEIRLLPALPKAWKNGSVSGLMARGNFEVDLSWADGTLTEVKITSRVGGNGKVCYGDASAAFSLGAGETVVMKGSALK